MLWIDLEYLGSLEPVLKCHKLIVVTLLVWRLAAQDEPLGDKGNQGSYWNVQCLAVRRVP